MGFLVNLFAASPENPRFSLNDPAAWDALGAVPSSSGVQVNEETALTHSPWWRGVNLLANDTAKLPLFVYSVKGDGKQKAKKHPAYHLLRWKPNDFQTAGVFRKQLMGHALSRGNGYAYIFRNGAMEPTEILPLSPYDTYPVRENGKLWYVTKVSGKNIAPGDEDRKLAPENVLHIKGFGFDGMMGYAVIDKAREALGLGLGERKYQSIYFRNNARPSIILMHPGKLPDKVKAELGQSWERMQSGLENAHRTAILDNGLTAKEISFNAVDSQLLESRRFDLIDVANFLCIPSHKLGDKSGQSYNSLEQENQAYLDTGLDPWLCTWEEECRDKLLTEEEKDDETAEVLFDRRKLIRANLADRTNYWRTALGGQPWRTVEEARIDDDENPEPDVGEIKTPLNMGPGGPPAPPGQPGQEPGNGPLPPPPKRPALPAPSEPPPSPKKPKKKAMAKAAKIAAKAERNARLRAAHAELLADAVRRMVRRIGLHAERAAKDHRGWQAWVESFEAEHRDVVREAVGPASRAAALLGGECNPEHVPDCLLTQLRLEFDALADGCTPKTLAVECAALVADQAERLPKVACNLFAGSPDQPRDADGKFGTGGGSSSAAAKAHAALAKIGQATKTGLVKAGASVMHVEHAAAEWIAEKAGAVVARLPERWQPVIRGMWRATRIGASVAFATHIAGQAAAEAVAVERGLNAAQAKALRGVLSTIDTAATKPIALGLELTGLGHLAFPASLVPVASTAYLAYSAARHPLATIRAARKGIRAVGKKIGLSAEVSAPAIEAKGPAKPVRDIADRLKAKTGDSLDWYVALLSAALDETGDVAAAVKRADAAFESMPEQADAPEEGDDAFFDELDEEQGNGPSPAGARGAGGPGRFFAGSPDQPRDDHGRFGSGGGGREEHEKKAKEKFAADMRKNTTLHGEKRQVYYAAAKSVYARMPGKALERMNANTAAHSFFNDKQEMTDAIIKDDPRMKDSLQGSLVGGSYNRPVKTLELDGRPKIDRVELDVNHGYAHEFSHAIDGPKREISGGKPWQEAWQAEIKGAQISRYGATSASEGFAEFGRMLYASDVKRSEVEKRFPKSAKVWKEQGLW